MSRARLAVVAVAVLTLSSCGSGSQAIDTSGISFVKQGTLTACSDIPYEPFEFTEGDLTKGIDVDLVRAVASDLGLKAAFTTVAFDGIFDAVNSGKCDLVASSVSITDERKQNMLFSNGYFEINQALLVRAADAAQFQTLDALKGHKVGVQKATTGETYVNGHNHGATVVPLGGATELNAALEARTIDAVVQDYPVASYQAKTNTALAVTQTFSDVDREEYGFAFAKANTKLQAAVNESLVNIRKDGRYDTILETYLGQTTAD